MSVHVVLMIYAVGAAAIALWLIVRFPSLGPRRITSVLLMALAALLGMRVALALIDPVGRSGSYGVVRALMLVILPALTWVFWSAALMMRTLAQLRP